MTLARAGRVKNSKNAMGNRNKKLGISQKIIIFNNNNKVLTIRRTKTAPSRPLYWDLPGGDLDFGEEPKKGIIRETKEETGLKIKNPVLLDVASGINDVKIFWVTICYYAKTNNTNIVLSYEHDKFKWVEPKELEKMKISPKNRKFVKKFIELRKKIINKNYDI